MSISIYTYIICMLGYYLDDGKTGRYLILLYLREELL